MSAADPTLFGVVLVADGDVDRGKGIAEACARRGLATRFAAHGAEALEIALAEPPDVVVAAVGVPLIDAPRLAGILRANPRTQAVRFVLVGGGPAEALGHAAIDARVAAPVEPEAVVQRIALLLARERTGPGEARRPGDETDLEGRLAQLGLADLLQLFHMNRKTGSVELVRRAAGGGEERGRVAVVDGNVVDAQCGAIAGEKALLRLLAWRSGNFSFRRTRPAASARIHTPTRALLLEGMRQLDELARLRTELPSLDAEVVLRVASDSLPPAAHPLARELLSLVRDFPRVGDLLDHSTHPDYQVLRALHALVERGVLGLRRFSEPRSHAASETLFSGAQLGRLRDWAERHHGPAANRHDARLLVASSDPAATRDFLGLLDGLPDVCLDRGFREGRFSGSTLRRFGRLGPEHEVGIELLHLPAHPSCEPLWPLAASSALGLLCLARAPKADGLRGLEALRRCVEADARLQRAVVLLEPGQGASQGPRPEVASESHGGACVFHVPAGEGWDARPALSRLLASFVP